MLAVLINEDVQALLENARNGNAEAAVTPSMQTARALVNDGLYRFGFDVGLGVCKGKSINGPGQDKFCLLLGPSRRFKLPDGTVTSGSLSAQQGYRVAQALQHGISKARIDASLAGVTSAPPSEAAGMLIAAGISGSGLSSDQKAATMQTVTNNASMTEGASTVVAKKVGFFAKILAFFGM